MQKLLVVGMFIAAFCVGMAACNPFRAQSTKWEYQVVSFDGGTQDGSPQDKLNKFGRDGWELVSVQQWEVNGNTQAFFGKACLKRPLAQ